MAVVPALIKTQSRLLVANAGHGSSVGFLTIGPLLIPSAGLKNFSQPKDFSWVEFPERKKLKLMEKVPTYPAGVRAPKMFKNLRFMRGPELVHNELIHKQYGIVALGPGRLRHGHLEMLRLTLGRFIDQNRMFAIWRVDPPWQSVTRKGQGQRMGGGKGSIDHYVTPIKHGRIILEMGGTVEFAEVRDKLNEVAHKLPFPAQAVNQEILDRWAEKKRRKEEDNINPYTFKYLVKNNLWNCHNWISPYDRIWYGEHT